MRRSRAWTWLACAALLLPGCSGERPDPLVVLYMVDTLRADRLGIYGYSLPTSPHIDALSAEAIVVESAYAPAPWTLPSVVSLMTSSYPAEHGVLKRSDRLADDAVPLAQRMRDLGYRTGAFVANPFAGKLSGLDRGFDHMVERKGHALDLDAIESWLKQGAGTPQFLYLHSTEPHRPYHAPENFVSRFGTVEPSRRKEIRNLLRAYSRAASADFDAGLERGTTDTSDAQLQAIRALAAYGDEIDIMYDSGVAWADGNIGRVITMLERLGLWSNTVLVLVSDHGEELHDHEGWLHSQHVYEELVHIPMLWRIPGVGARRLDGIGPLSLLDVAPTLIALAGGTPPESAAGRNLLAVLREPGRRPDRDLQIVANRIDRQNLFAGGDGDERGDVNVALIDGPWKGIWNADTDGFELYDLSRDPDESRDLAAERADVASRMREHAREWLRARDSVEPAETRRLEEDVDPDTLERLRELGYL